MMPEVNVVNALSGGALIGVASILLLALAGRIAGISGILGGLVTGSIAGDRLWRLAFLVGLVIGAVICSLVVGPLRVQLQAEGWQLLLAGLLVGFGTRLGSGCTSGHGVCGIARLSPRSITATLIFISTGMVTVYLVRHISL